MNKKIETSVGTINIMNNEIPKKSRLIPEKEIRARKSWAVISARFNKINTGMRRKG